MGLPVLFSYEHAQYGTWMYNVTSLWNVVFYMFVCSRGLGVEDSLYLTVLFKKVGFHIANESVTCS